MSVCPLNKLQWPFVCRHFFSPFETYCEGLSRRVASGFAAVCCVGVLTHFTPDKPLPNYHTRDPCPGTLNQKWLPCAWQFTIRFDWNCMLWCRILHLWKDVVGGWHCFPVLLVCCHEVVRSFWVVAVVLVGCLDDYITSQRNSLKWYTLLSHFLIFIDLRAVYSIFTTSNIFM